MRDSERIGVPILPGTRNVPLTESRIADPRLNRAEIQHRCEACGHDEDTKEFWYGTLLLFHARDPASDPHRPEPGVETIIGPKKLPGLSPAGLWPQGAVDRYLAELGYQRTGPWTANGPAGDEDPHHCMSTAPIEVIPAARM
jgi:hypothetical protein